MLAAKSFNQTSQAAQLEKWMQILAEELAERLAEDSELNARRPRTLTLYYRQALHASRLYPLGDASVRLQQVHPVSLLYGTMHVCSLNGGVCFGLPVTAQPNQPHLSLHNLKVHRGRAIVGAQSMVPAALQTVQPCVCRGSQGDRSKANSAPRPGREGYTAALLLEAGNVLLRKCYDVYPCTRLALQASQPGMCCLCITAPAQQLPACGQRGRKGAASLDVF